MLIEKKTFAEKYGIDFIKLLYHLIHAIRLHKDNNQTIKQSVVKFKGILNEMTKEDDMEIQLWRGRFHMGGEKLPYSRDVTNIINELTKYFSSRGVGGLHFSKNFSKAPPLDILMFIRLLDISLKHEYSCYWLNKELVIHGLSWVKVLEKYDDDLQISGDKEEKAKNAYQNALETVKEVADKASRGIAGIRKARRVAQTIVDLIQEDSSLMLGLTTIKNYDDYTYTHSVNVSLLATCLGRHIGLSNISLEHLSVCALFHDLGKIGVPKEVLLKQGELSSEEWSSMQRHPLIGVNKILRLNAEKILRSRIILGPFEHHLNPDITGYPKTHFMKNLSLSGMILRIADVYEALTSERAYRPRAFTPNEALRKMWGEVGKSFHQILLKSFIQMMGIYPVGSVVELSDSRMALVMDYSDESDKTLPLLLILKNDGEGGLIRGGMLNLYNQAAKSDSSRVNIVRSIPPSSIGLQVSQFFLKEK